MIKSCEVAFASDSLEEAFNKIPENNEVKGWIINAIRRIEQNAFCGIQLPKYLIPEDYVSKYKITNLWKYNLPEGWRLLYSITTPNKVEILTIILDWFNHKDYERKFKY